MGLNMGSLLRIPRARLLSGTERLGSLIERKGYKEWWATVERSLQNGFYRKPGHRLALCGN
jgi:dissimilatory sulfite reductase (desulfoviridin) alpha/beta subunit